MCYHKKNVVVEIKRPSIGFPESRLEIQVPCGRCVACLKRRQTDYSTRILREVESASSMWFITLTYDNEHLPILGNSYLVDSETGELIPYFIPYYDKNEMCFKDDKGNKFWCDSKEVRDELIKIPATQNARYVRKFLCDSDGEPLCVDGYYMYSEYTPSLNREHVKNWLKGCRVQYERDYDEKLSFTYAWCGEYGGYRSRPHYHMVLLNLSYEQVCYMLSRWKYGYTYKKYVPKINEDGSNARQIAARYIGKYVSKGKFDLDSVVAGDAYKGRLCNSKRFGTKDFNPEEIAYYRAYDLYGEYDINSFCKVPKYFTIRPRSFEYLSEEQRLNVVKEVIKRSFYPVQVKDKVLNLPLPKSFRVRLFYVKDSFYDKKKKRVVNSLRASLLSRAVMDYLQSVANDDNKRKYELFCSERNISEDDINSVIAFEACNEVPEFGLSEKLDEIDFKDSLLRSSKDFQ